MKGMVTRHPHTGRPKAVFSALELRVLLELAILPASLPILLTAPRGDGHPVLLLPGFMGTEATLIGLDVFLRNRGYAVETWGLGRNVGFHVKHATALEQKIRHMHYKAGRKISLVGWSLGGVFALGCAWGAVFQPFLGPRMNLYTGNVSWYIGYVSVAVILVWGIGLTSVYSAHLLVARLAGARPRFRHFAVVSAPVVTLLEVVGSNVIQVKLQDHDSYRALMPALNAMNAPAWLYLFYLVVGGSFYAVILACRLDAGIWRLSVFARPRVVRVPRRRPAFIASLPWWPGNAQS
jgi:hypothetical protein